MLLSSVPPFNSITLSPIKTTVTVTIPSACHHRFTFIRRHHSSPNFKFVRNSMREAESVTLLEAEEAELLLATCITRTLPPALTLESGLGIIKNTVEELKTKPSCAKSGMYRFQFGKSSATTTYGVLPAANVPPPYALASISAVQFDHCGQRFATAALDGTVCTRQLEFGKSSATATYGVRPAANVPPTYALASISAVQFGHCGQRFATAALDGTVCTRQLEVGGRSNIYPTESSLCFNNYTSYALTISIVIHELEQPHS